MQRHFTVGLASTMWKERNNEHPNYARISYVWQQHHRRFVSYVERFGLPCQDCGGRGGYVEVIIDGTGPFYECGWCLGTGKTTRWLRGLWLKFKRDEAKLKRRQKWQTGKHSSTS